ncbi:hypothetical protein [Catellatospora sichuanensis]|uniref:hypothetical protein n=1 Tax=Catellatospora sichuanensis TaxID=1969805 RepID=UPI0016430D88|nr:hypothetical protein [Catellatospora sichuanensis]
MTIGMFVALAGGCWWLAEQMDWNVKAVTAAVAIPYWLVVTVVWRRYGPAMPGL